jgi:hypothetical protein
MNNSMVPNNFKDQIMKEIVLPNYRRNIEYNIKTRTCWSIVSNACLASSTLLIGLSSLLAFSSSSFPGNNLNFYSGAVGVVAIIFKEFSSYANNQDHLKTVKLNDIFKNLGIDFHIEDYTTATQQVIDSTNTMANPSSTNNTTLNTNTITPVSTEENNV